MFIEEIRVKKDFCEDSGNRVMITVNDCERPVAENGYVCFYMSPHGARILSEKINKEVRLRK